MKALRSFTAIALCVVLIPGLLPADYKTVNPKIQEMLDQVSEARIRAILEKLESFGTRNTMSNPDDPVHGVGAARTWILNEFKSYSPRLQMRFDKYRVKKQGQRIFKDVDLWNVVAVLPGTKQPETQVVVSAHYDSLNLGNRPAGAPAGPATDGATGGGTLNATAGMTPADFEKNANLPAPGVCDDGSGTAAVMELARVMSQFEFDKTLVFVAFAGEEQGLIGSSLFAAKAHKENQVIEAVLNNDIIGTDVAGNGRTGNSTVSIYSDETMDSISQQLARYTKEAGERYLPGMKVNTIFMGDRLGRGGDHTPFQWEGFAAVRVSTPNEIYANQHRATDTLINMSVPYTTKVAKVNLAVAASLADAPKPPIVMPEPRANAPAMPAGRRPGPMIARGGGYDAVLRWRTAGSDADIKGYAIVIRATTSPYWEQEIYVGKVNTYTLKDVSIDDLKFGVKAIGVNGSESLVTAYVYPPRQRVEIETVQ
ncbi:MAG TPA: M28 family peptidase [Candidatus Acidoferrales bacterium]|nr:M28 family peptidase [Candidatus Acidoferrales bacterium]